MALLIYIPLWFNYYDDVGFTYKIHCVFTFHYGSITIHYRWNSLDSYSKFTFHYGSITIFVPLIFSFPSAKFTFHYGSITIISKWYFDGF